MIGKVRITTLCNRCNEPVGPDAELRRVRLDDADDTGPDHETFVDRFQMSRLVRPYPRLLRWPLRWLQRLCRHEGLKADILEGCAYPHAVRWCETCGAVWQTIEGTPCGSPRMPEPTWED